MVATAGTELGPTSAPVAVPRFASGRGALVLVAAAGFLLTLGYVWMGPGYVMDDWYTLANGHFDGVLHTIDDDQWHARPGAGVIYGFVFSVLGGHPALAVLFQGLVASGTAALLVKLFRRFTDDTSALLVGLLWAVLPTHTSLVMWISASNIGLSTLLGVVGALGLASDRARTRKAAVVALVLGILAYEALAPIAAFAVLAIPWLRSGRPDLKLTAYGALLIGGTVGWILLHWNPNKDLQPTPQFQLALGGHFGEGAIGLGSVGDLAALATVLAVVLIGWRALTNRSRPGWRLGANERLVLAGIVVLVLGLLPFARYFYAPYGAGDRFHFVSAIGGAMVWAGLLQLLAEVKRLPALVLTGLVLVAGSVAHLRQADVWHRGGQDAEAILDAVVATYPSPPDGTIVIGPAPVIERGVTPFLSRSNIEYAVRLRYDDRSAAAAVTQSEADFERFEHRIDIRPLVSLDATRDD